VILGLALVINIFGEIAVSKMIMILVFLLPLQYTLSVIALTLSDNTEKRSKAVARMIKSIFTNPIIISAFLAIIFSLISIKLPSVLINTGNYLAAITLPLALIGLGGSLRIKQLQSLSIITIGSSILKLLISPIIATTAGYFLGYGGADLGVIYIIFSSPTAVVSYIIADSMTPHGKLAGNIVLITTLLSAITIPLGLILLNQLQLI
jgi:predicted permease